MTPDSQDAPSPTQFRLDDKERLQKLIQIMMEMADASKVDELLRLLLYGALELVGQKRGSIGRLNHTNGELFLVEQTDNPGKRNTKVRFGQGIIGRALEIERPIRVDNVLSADWKDIYAPVWQDTCSELAIPILVEQAQIREGAEVKRGTKRIGVLNLESPECNAFSETDEEHLCALTRYAAIKIDRLESEKKLKDLRYLEQQIANEKDYDRIIKKVLDGITKVLGFEVVNISLINPERTRIRSEHVIGIPGNNLSEFKRLADHGLTSTDIQAHIVQSRKIEVPDSNDNRFDQEIFNKFGHNHLIRVFIPMIEVYSDRVIGTVEAGYKKRYLKYIYESDIQILESFVNYAVQALERRKSSLIERIMHELRSPIVGIRSHSSFLQRRFNEISQDIIDRKFEDIQTDCDVLLYQVGQLEYSLSGRSPRRARIEKTSILRDVIIKTIYQLRPIINERKFDISRIEYNSSGGRGKITVLTDKAKLNQVFYNLLMNAIKYSESNAEEFQIQIDIEENRETIITKFRDWGIGIEREYVTDVFKEGFRTPEAIRKNVSGSGLGLTISKAIMEQLGGDLRLVHSAKPTEFHIIIPKKIKEIEE